MFTKRLWRIILLMLLILVIGSLVQIGVTPPVRARGVNNASETLSQYRFSANLTQDVLYDQTDNPGGSGFASQEFEATSSDFDSQGADDFIILATDSQWTIERIEVLGSYSNGGGPTPLVNVYFYADAAGLPGTTLFSAEGLSPTSDIAGDLTIDLPTPAILSTGTYWLSVQADMDFGSSGQWFWASRTVQSSNAYVWRNPGGGFGTGCSTWAPATTVCGIGAIGEPDTLFRLLGTKSLPETKIYLPGIGKNWSPPTPPPPPPPADWPCLYVLNWWRSDSPPHDRIYSSYSPPCLMATKVDVVHIIDPIGCQTGYRATVTRQGKPDFDMDVIYIPPPGSCGVTGANVTKTYVGGYQYQMEITKFCPNPGPLVGYRVKLPAPPFNGQEVEVGNCPP